MAYIGWPYGKSVIDVRSCGLNINEQREIHDQKARDFRITTFALAAIAIFLLGLSYGLYGLGTLPPTVLSGLGMLPYLGGVFFSFVTIGLVTAALVTAVISGIHTMQKGRWGALADDTNLSDV